MSGDGYFLTGGAALFAFAVLRLLWGAALVLIDVDRGEPRCVWSPAADPPPAGAGEGFTS